MESLANKYRPKTFEDMTEQSVIVDMLKSICSADDVQCRNFLLIGPAGTGKAQPLYSKILTPNGFVQMGDITIGQEVFTDKGHIGKVLEIYPQGVRKIFRITLDDNSYIDVADNHLNCIWTFDHNLSEMVEHVVNTVDLYADFSIHQDTYYVSVPSVDYPSRDVPIASELYGLMLASEIDVDTALLQFPYVNNLQDQKKIDDLLRDSTNLHICTKMDHMTHQAHLSLTSIASTSVFLSVRDTLATVSTDNRHIPDCYLYNTESVRIRLLKGIFAGFTTAKQGSRTILTIPDKTLSDDIAVLVRSLGLIDIVQPIGNIADDNQVPSQAERYVHFIEHRTASSQYRRITNIKYLHDDKCQCIMVDHDDHTYISDLGLIPTHNTTLSRIMANVLNHGEGEPIELDAASHSGVDAMREIVSQAQSYPIGSKYKVFIIDEAHSISQQGWQVLLKTLEASPARSIMCFCTTNPEKIPATILSRVQTFQLAKISLSGIYSRLVKVLETEKQQGREITYTEDAINYIAKLANGGMRDALTLLDKALAYSSDITSESIEKSLNLPNYDDYFDLLSAYSRKDNAKITEIVDKVYNSGVNFVKWFEGFHSFVANIVKYIFLHDIAKTMIPTHYNDKISKYTTAHAVVCLKLANKLIKLIQDLKSTQYLQEVALTYLCAVSQAPAQK